MRALGLVEAGVAAHAEARQDAAAKARAKLQSLERHLVIGSSGGHGAGVPQALSAEGCHMLSEALEAVGSY